jgi:hypothetical protein
VSFGVSYTVPLPKIFQSRSRNLSVDEFRGIAISVILSKVFEKCILDRFGDYFFTSDSQFGFKPKSSCSQAIFAVRNYCEYIVNNGGTANICAIDISKAFDKLNHKCIFIKLIERRIPAELLHCLMNWFSRSYSCVKWFNYYSMFYKLDQGVRQGAILSPIVFALCIDSIVEHNVFYTSYKIFLYADDVLIVSSALGELQSALSRLELNLKLMDMYINDKKCVCIRIGRHFSSVCSSLMLSDGRTLPWSQQLRYLGVFIRAGQHFRCDYSNCKQKFCRSVNSLFAKLGRYASEEVMISLVTTKGFPGLLYALEACPVLPSDLQSFDFCIYRFIMKLFHTSSRLIADEIISRFGICLPSVVIPARTARFLKSMEQSSNPLCSLCCVV